MKEYGYQESHFEVERKKLKNLWFVVKFFLATESYILIFTIWSFTRGRINIKGYDEATYDINIKVCNLITGIESLDIIFWTLKRLCIYNIWLYPIVRVCWPSTLKRSSYIDHLTPSEIENVVEVIDEIVPSEASHRII